ncbi:MAG: succinylglutamate desuccinylase/aspartoacylase family protein [Anaerolineae bacterium]|nr:succinylglutamate desuccinylase/aspartoacylase family protein [Anaerolineae bacterium]
MAREPIHIGGITVEAGSRGFGFLHVGYLAGRTEVRIPFQVVHGAYDGPTLGLESTLHGWEPMGAEVIRRGMLGVDPKQLHGTVLCLPIANPFSIEFSGQVESAGSRVNPADQLDMNRVWPGKAKNAWLTEQMAYVMWNEIITKCDYLLDFHDGTGSCDEIPVAFPHAFDLNGPGVMQVSGADGTGGGGGRAVTRDYAEGMNKKIRDLAIAFGSSVIWWREETLNPVMISSQGNLNGIATLVVECGGMGIVDETIDQGAVCIHNIMKSLNMLAGAPQLPERQIMVSHYVVYRSLCGGFYLGEPGTRLGVEVRKGQLLGRVVDPITSEVVEECVSPVNGVIVSRRVRLPINPGGYIAHIADTDSILWERSTPALAAGQGG